MIIRILGEGQFELTDEQLDSLNTHDDEIISSVENNDSYAFRTGLQQLLQSVRQTGRRLPDDCLKPSDLVLPGEDASIDDVRGLLEGAGREEGLIPG